MGKKIDEFVLGTAFAAGLYFYFNLAFRNRIIAALLALLGFILLRKLLHAAHLLFSKSAWARRRHFRKHSGGAVLQLAMMPQEEAEKKLRVLIGKCYGSNYDLALIQNHPDTALSPQSVFEQWKAHRGKERFVLFATCRADAACKSLAASLKGPKLAIVDSAALGQMIAEHPSGFTFPDGQKKRIRLRLQHIANLLFNRKNAPRCILLSAAMLMLYALTGNKWNLISAMALLFVSLASFRRTLRPAKLF